MQTFPGDISGHERFGGDRKPVFLSCASTAAWGEFVTLQLYSDWQSVRFKGRLRSSHSSYVALPVVRVYFDVAPSYVHTPGISGSTEKASLKHTCVDPKGVVLLFCKSFFFKWTWGWAVKKKKSFKSWNICLWTEGQAGRAECAASMEQGRMITSQQRKVFNLLISHLRWLHSDALDRMLTLQRERRSLNFKGGVACGLLGRPMRSKKYLVIGEEGRGFLWVAEGVL